MSSANMFWNLFYKDVFSDLKNEADVLVLIVHWNLVRNFELKCIGLGEEKTDTDIEQGDELLPKMWNQNDNLYVLRYKHATKNLFYILSASIINDYIHFKLTNMKTLTVSNSSVRITGTVKPLHELIHIERQVPNVRKIIDRCDIELLKMVKKDVKSYMKKK